MKILVALDFSPHFQRVAAFGKELADALRCEVWLLHVADPEPDFMGYDAGPQVERDLVATELRHEHRELQALAAKWRADGLSCTALLIQGRISESILAEAARLAVDLIVIGNHAGGTMRRLFVGSTSEGVLSKSPIPVLVVPISAVT
jgi:nucleotide-binding universal stress UspA family protein